ncbi:MULTISPECIES: xanthine dehydrogenase family protein molybdopterin-binding subunit [unclassified Roseovarius]|uniref:xanthine dehydrogenase family protein molybdopterin-binding subunit n=1 Tax=unclassified Roseovarius TaxID=2614913 RepID=UPI00273F7614|nr:xanthine dehydrogenase family protein molybdopterin-binding subunit [Roseovarius sp. MMSF_3350]
MAKFGRAQPVSRIEDRRFLTGAGRYTSDLWPEGCLRAYVLRSVEAHAEMTVDVQAAREAEGVRLVLTADDLAAAGITEGMPALLVENRDGSMGAAPKRPLLAEGRVRFVGEAIALVVAESLDAARDAAELIEVEYDSLPVHLERAPGGQTLHDAAPENRAFDFGMGDAAAVEAALAGSAHVVRMPLEDNRVISNPMETRSVLAQMEEGRLHIAYGGQNVWNTKVHAARILKMDEADIRVTIPDVGGGFGTKAPDYPETLLVAQAARSLEAPVAWVADRTEGMLSDTGARDLCHDLVMGFDDDLRITAYRVDTRMNLGAYNSPLAQNIQTNLFAKVMMGVYDIRAAYLHVEGFYTNTTPVDAYRGAGRPEAIYALERMMDHAARELGVDVWELHRRNFIRPDQFPYTTAFGETYDVGDFARVLESVARHADKAGFAARRAASEAQGRLRGMGLCFYIESILGDPAEGVQIEFTDEGVRLYVGTISNGQGHESVYAQFLSDQTGVPVERIEIVQGDTDRIAQGGGTDGSRSVTVQNNVTLVTVDAMIDAFRPYLAEKMGVDADAVEFDNETFRAPGSNQTPTLLEATAWARADGRDDLLSHKQRAELEARSFPNGAHVCEVEVDPETGAVTVARYTVVDDFGNLINPMLVEGQIHGGVAQGIGQALCERVVYNEDGQLLTASFMDYAMPRADNLPMIAFETEPVPSTTNVMGMKGCGEAGTVGAMAATANAVFDALHDRGVSRADMPFTPHRVWMMLRSDELDETR